MIQLQAQKGGQAGNSSARELQLEEQLAEARSIIDEQVSEPNLLNHLLFGFYINGTVYYLIHGF